MQTVNYVEVNKAGLAEIKAAKLLVGDILILMFLYEWSAEDLIDCFPKLTSRGCLKSQIADFPIPFVNRFSINLLIAA